MQRYFQLQVVNVKTPGDTLGPLLLGRRPFTPNPVYRTETALPAEGAHHYVVAAPPSSATARAQRPKYTGSFQPTTTTRWMGW